MTMRTLYLTSGHPNPNAVDGEPRRYQVERVTNSVTYSPGQFLERNEVKDLCDSSGWTVHISARKFS